MRMQYNVLPSFGDLLRRHRQAAGLTQEALAERASLSVRAISDLERGVKQHPHRDTVRLLVAALILSEQDRLMLEAAARRLPTAANIALAPTLTQDPPDARVVS